ncbi:uncharacterized protein K02A2.6-like [Achroia grisella]|uniref:uncharacterized protein K02A2.6-like n=1 Tax=Achroia grisella TaxID=688607 RepID=UPI0027D21C96|nr:uncharacterized protein K02A2.6-like [Achroia grisella]
MGYQCNIPYILLVSFLRRIPAERAQHDSEQTRTHQHFFNVLWFSCCGIDGVVCFLDDALIAAPTPQLHWERVEQVLNRLRGAGLILQKSKCSFLQEKVEYLGFIINRDGIHKNPNKIKAIMDVKVPLNTKQLKSFLGIVNFYHSFIPQAAVILEPLHSLLRKDVEWVWSEKHQKSFNDVKKELGSSRVLAHFDPRQQLVLTVDAAPGGLGAVLAVRYHNGTERPISYASRALNKSERKYSQIQKEATAIIYVEMEPPEVDTCTELPSYINALAEAGAALPASLGEMQSATIADNTLSAVIQYVNKGWPRKVRAELLPFSRCQHELHVDNGCLMRGHRVVVPEMYRPAVIQELHAAHLGIIKMKSLARERCWYPGIDRDIEQVVSNCDRCISLRSSPPKATLEPWDWPLAVFDRIHLDYLGPLHNKTFLCLVDAHSKWIECLDMSNMTSQCLIFNLKKVFSRFGLPKTIVTDNATTFTSAEFAKFCKVNGIIHILTPVYSPQSNGLAENAVRTCKKFIKNALKDGTIKNINSRLDDYLFHYRNTPHCTTGVSPSMLMFNRNLRCKLDLISVGASTDTAKQSFVNDRVRLHQGRQRRNFGGKGRFFSQGDNVWIRDYRFNPKKPVWVLGSVVNRVGKVLYHVNVKGTDIVWRRHVNQLLDAKINNRALNRAAWSYEKHEGATAQCHESVQSASSPIAPESGVPDASGPPARSPRTPPGSPEPSALSDADDGLYGTPPSDVPDERSTLRVSSVPEVRRTRSGRRVYPPKILFL